MGTKGGWAKVRVEVGVGARERTQTAERCMLLCVGASASPERGLDGGAARQGVSRAPRAGEAARPRGPSSAPGKWPPSSRPCRSVRTPSPSPWRDGPAARVPSALRRARPCRSASRGPPPAATAAPASRAAAASACQAGSRKYAPRLAASSALCT